MKKVPITEKVSNFKFLFFFLQKVQDEYENEKLKWSKILNVVWIKKSKKKDFSNSYGLFFSDNYFASGIFLPKFKM